MRRRRIATAIILMVCATILGSLVPAVSHNVAPRYAGILSAIMLTFEIAAYAMSIALIVRQLRAASRAPLGRGSSHL